MDVFIMKPFLKILISFISLFVALVAIINVSAATVYEIDGYILRIEDDGTKALGGWNGDATNLVIPFSIENNYITEISDSAFEGNENILSLDMNEAYSLKHIGIMAFKDCINLGKSITIPSRISSIGLGAFEGCTSINSATVHSGIKTIPTQLFYKCSSLETVILSTGITTVEKLAFADCTSLKEINIPKTVTSINSTAFNGCTGFTIKGYRDSYAQQFAQDNGYDFYILDPLLGDSNADGDVDIMDATYIQKYKIGAQGYDLTEYQRRCADVNRDGKVTVRDATLIQMKLAKYDVDF